MINNFIVSFKYYINFFRLNIFKQKPLIAIFRLAHLFFLLTFDVKSTFKVYFGSGNFKFTFYPLSKSMGGRGFFLQRNYIEDLMMYGSRFIKKDSVCLDAGANQGIFTLAFLSLCSDKGKVVSIEPFKYATSILKKNLLINNFKNCKVLNKVLSDKENKNYTLDYSKGVGKASIIFDRKKKNTLRVKSVTIDSIFRGSRLDFIKLDIEGAELLALIGGKHTISKYKPIISLECRPTEFKKIQSLLHKYSYSAYKFTTDAFLVKINKINKFENNIFFISSKMKDYYKVISRR